MKPITLAGIVLVILGALVLIYQGFDYTQRKNVIDVGPIHATVDDQRHVSLPPILGALALAGGIALLVVGVRQKTK